MKKITDKERLDFLIKVPRWVFYGGSGYWRISDRPDCKGRSKIKVIDAAIRAERKAGRK